MWIADLHKRWDEHAAKHAIVPEMTFTDGFLVLGAATRLAKVGAAIDKQRLVAQLAAAHRRPIEAPPLRHIERALAAQQRGDAALAYTHIALSKLAKLALPREDARWLFTIDALMQAGADPLAIVEGLGTDPAVCGMSLGKYSPDQPRVSAGNPDGGQWTSGSADSGGESGAAQRRGVQVADASTTRGQEITSDALPDSATPQAPKPPDSAPIELAQDTSQTCAAYIATNRQARILREFPGQFLTQSLQDVLDAAKAGDPAARKACKLLFDNRFAK